MRRIAVFSHGAAAPAQRLMPSRGESFESAIPVPCTSARAIRVRHYSVRTEQSYIDWIVRFIRFHNRRHPRDLGEADASCGLADYGCSYRFRI
jgi:hypothetical protein